MIVSKEQRDVLTGNGMISKELVVSYVGANGEIQFLTYPIPQTEMFKWKYTTRSYADRTWRSFDNKFVRRVPAKMLNEPRVNELLSSFGRQIDPIFEMNIPKTWFCDIEVDVDDEGFSEPEDGRTPINTIAITHYPNTYVFGRRHLAEEEKASIQKKISEYSSLTKDYKFTYIEFANETAMLKSFIDFIAPLPAITGWNFLEYDWRYIMTRCEKDGIDFKKVSPTRAFSREKFAPRGTGQAFYVNLPKHKIVYDYMMVYGQWDKSIAIKENYTLDWTAEAVLGIKKVQHNMGFQEFYKNYYEDYVFYNAIDTILVEQIDKKINTALIWYTLVSELKIDCNMAFSTIGPAEVVMCNYIYPEHKVLPEKDNGKIEAGGYEGAFVWPARMGIYKHVASLDFASLYPSTMRQFNISPETYKGKVDAKTYKPKDNEILCSTGAVYDKTYKGIIPRILTDYYQKRKDAKNDKKQANKEYEELKHILEQRKQKESNNGLV